MSRDLASGHWVTYMQKLGKQICTTKRHGLPQTLYDFGDRGMLRPRIWIFLRKFCATQKLRKFARIGRIVIEALGEVLKSSHYIRKLVKGRSVRYSHPMIGKKDENESCIIRFLVWRLMHLCHNADRKHDADASIL